MSFRDIFRRPERRRAPRFEAKDLVAYYWTGAPPYPHKVRQIGLYGAQILAPELFYPGTLLIMVLEDRAAQSEDGYPKPNISVCAQAVRRVAGGFSAEFVFANAAERRGLLRFLEKVTREVPKEAKAGEAGAPATAGVPESAPEAAGHPEPDLPEQGPGSGESALNNEVAGHSEAELPASRKAG